MSREGVPHLYKRGRTYAYRVQIDGKNVTRSLRTGSKPEALKRLKQLEAETEHRRFHGEARHRWEEAVVSWLADAVGQYRLKTLERYKFSLAKVRGILDGLYVDQIDLRTIAKIARRPGVTHATRRRDITAVSAVLRWCVAQGWRQDNPAQLWDRTTIRETREPIRLPEPYDIECAIAAAPRAMAPLIRFAQYTGMRQEEIASLEWPQIDKAGRTATLTRTKSGRTRVVTLDERAAVALAVAVRHVRSPVVFWHDDGQRYHNLASQFGAVMRRAIALAKKERRPIPQRFRFHDLRHWYAVDYLRAGGNIYRLSKTLGHTSVKTTEIYLDFLPPEAQERAKFGEGLASQ